MRVLERQSPPRGAVYRHAANEKPRTGGAGLLGFQGGTWRWGGNPSLSNAYHGVPPPLGELFVTSKKVRVTSWRLGKFSHLLWRMTIRKGRRPMPTPPNKAPKDGPPVRGFTTRNCSKTTLLSH